MCVIRGYFSKIALQTQINTAWLTPEGVPLEGLIEQCLYKLVVGGTATGYLVKLVEA